MPIKMTGSNEYRLPQELEQFQFVIQQIIDHEHAMLTEEQIMQYYAYLTISQSLVQQGATQRNPGLHVDGFQGARINPKTLINHTYIAMDQHPTMFYPQSYDFSHLDEQKHNFFKEMERLADPSKILEANLMTIYLLNAYTVHSSSIANTTVYRTFLRLSYDTKEFDRLGNTHNPHFNYSWNMVSRDAHAHLEKYK